MLWYSHAFGSRVFAGHGFHFDNLHTLHQSRYWRLVAEHMHSLNACCNGLSALPGTAQPFAATKAMSRFLHHPDTPLPALIEPIQESVRAAVTRSTATVALVVHDWSMFGFHTHTGKADRYRRSGVTDLGYELGTALVLDGADGRPLGPMEFRVRTATGTLTTRPGGAEQPPAHLDELAPVFAESRRWNLARRLIHIIDREADSVFHFRTWHADRHHFLVRANAKRLVRWRGQTVSLQAILDTMTTAFRDHPDGLTVATPDGTGRVQVAETAVVLDRDAKRMIDGVKTDIPGPPLPLRLVVTRVVDPLGVVRATWCLLTNADPVHNAATVARWYAWRWRIEMCQADYPSSRGWVCQQRIGYHRRNGVARTGRVVPATARQPRWSRSMPDTRRRAAPPRA